MALGRTVPCAGFVHLVVLVAVVAFAVVLPQLRSDDFALPEDARFQESYVPAVPRIPAALADPNAAQRFNAPLVFVIGEVAAPGVVELSQASSLAEILVLAGSPTVTAGHRVVVIRPKQAVRRAVALPGAADADTIEGSLALPPAVSDGDTLYVPPADVFAVLGEVRQPGMYILESSTSVMKAIALSGGLAEHGSNRRFTIVRVVNGKRTTMKAAATDVVAPNDILRVRRRLF